MASVPQIRTRLLEGFPEKQADLLAHVVIEAHDDLVNRADFHELTCVVKDLAEGQRDLVEAQARTERKVEELVGVQRDLAEAQTRTERRVEELAGAQRDLAEAQARTERRVEELAGAQRDLAEAQTRTEGRVEELAGAQRDLAEAQTRTEGRVEELAGAQRQTEGILTEVVNTQKKMLTRLDRLDGHMLEDKVARNLPAFLGREFRKCRVLERARFVEGLEELLAEDDLADLMRADTIATATRAGETLHIVVEASCTADADDLDRASRRATILAKAGFTAIGLVACEVISPQTLAEARRRGLRVLAGGWLLPDAA